MRIDKRQAGESGALGSKAAFAAGADVESSAECEEFFIAWPPHAAKTHSDDELLRKIKTSSAPEVLHAAAHLGPAGGFVFRGRLSDSDETRCDAERCRTCTLSRTFFGERHAEGEREATSDILQFSVHPRKNEQYDEVLSLLHRVLSRRSFLRRFGQIAEETTFTAY
ncbi:hypothetical protein SRHO_G00266920 [Serrasalmus rhombeus]